MKKKLLFLAAWFLSANVFALEVKLTKNKDYVEVVDHNKVIRVQRIQDQNHRLTGGFTKTSRKCPPFCIQPITPAEGIKTVGEYEIFQFMENELAAGEGVLVDARTPSWHKKGTIPGSISIPFKVFALDDDAPELEDAFERLGVIRRGEVGAVKRSLENMGLLNGDLKTDKWDFSAAKKIIFWCNGPWCGQSPHAIRSILKHGYPKSKIMYYRGGMQNWQMLGLTTIIPEPGE